MITLVISIETHLRRMCITADQHITMATVLECKALSCLCSVVLPYVQH